MTARALVLSAVCAGSSTLRAPLRARDTMLMAAGLRTLGAAVGTADDDLWVIRPHPLHGPAAIDVGSAGTVMRFLPAVAALAGGPVTFDGDRRARLRPMAPLIEALRTVGVTIDTGPGGGLPLTVHGTAQVTGGDITIDASRSSQLISGLLLAGATFDRGVVVRHVGPALPRAPHLRMTVQMLRAVGAGVDDATPNVWSVAPGRLGGRGWHIEPDLSAAAPFLAAALVVGGTVTIGDWPRSTTQAGNRLPELLHAMGGRSVLSTEGLTMRGTGVVHGLRADLSDVGELAPVLAALAVVADSPSRLSGLGHLRGHEADLLGSLAHELGRLGADIDEYPDGLEIRPRPLTAGLFDTHGDHRLAHAAAVVCLAVPGVELSDIGCTAKTMPDFRALWSAMLDPPAWAGQDGAGREVDR